MSFEKPGKLDMVLSQLCFFPFQQDMILGFPLSYNLPGINICLVLYWSKYILPVVLDNSEVIPRYYDLTLFVYLLDLGIQNGT